MENITLDKKLKYIIPKIISGVGITILIIINAWLITYYMAVIISLQTEKFTKLEEFSQFVFWIWMALYPYLISLIIIIPALKGNISKTLFYYFVFIFACLMIYFREL